MTNTLGLFRRSALPVALALSLVARPPAAGAVGGPDRPANLFRAFLAQPRPVPRRPRRRGVRGDRAARHVLHRTARRRRVEDDQRGPDVVPDLRRDQGRRRRSARSRSRRRIRTSIYVGTGDIITGGGDQRRQRRLQVDRRRARPGGTSASTRRSRSRRCSSIRAIRTSCCVAAQGDVHAKSRRPRRLPQHRRRRDVDANAVRRRQHRRAEARARVRHARRRLRDDRRALHAADRRPVGGCGGGGGRGGPQTGPTSTKLFKSVGRRRHVEGDHRRRTARASHGQARRSPWPTNTNAQRVFVIGDSGLFRSDDGGATWQQMAADDQRIRNGQGGYNCGVYVDPKNPDVVYTLNTASYKSHRRRQDLHRLQGRAGRRRSAADVDRSDQRPAHPLRLRPGRDRLARRRRARGARGTTSRPSRSTTSRSTTRSRTGSTARSRTPAPSARASAATSARSRRSTGIRCSGWEWGTIVARSARPEHRLRQRHRAFVKISLSERAVDQREPGAGSVAPAAHDERRSRSSSRRGISTCSSPASSRCGRRSTAARTGRRSAPTSAIRARRARRRPRQAAARRPAARSSRSALSTVARGHDLGRHQQWADQGHARRRQDVERRVDPRHSQRAARRGPLASSRRTSTPPRRTPCSTLHRLGDYTPYVYPHARLRQDVDAHHRRPRDESAERQLRARRARTTRSDAGCCSPAPRAACTSRSTTAITGSRCSSNLPTTSYRDIAIKDNDLVVGDVRPRLLGARRLHDAASGRRRASRARRRTSSSRATRCACAATSAPTRRSRPRCRTRSIRPTARIVDYWLAQAPSRRHHARRARLVRRARATPVERARSRR